MVVDGAMDGEMFTAYAEAILAPTLAPGDIVILDNLPAHKVTGARAAIEAKRAFMLFLPPYSPDFSFCPRTWWKFLPRRLGVPVVTHYFSWFGSSGPTNVRKLVMPTGAAYQGGVEPAPLARAGPDWAEGDRSLLPEFPHRPQADRVGYRRLHRPGPWGQQLALFNTPTDWHCLQPIHIYEAATVKPVAVLLRPGKRLSGEEAARVLRHLIRRIRANRPPVTITLRGDGYYGTPEVMGTLEAMGCLYFLNRQRVADIGQRRGAQQILADGQIGDLVVVSAGIQHECVVACAAGQRVVTGAADQDIVPGIALEHVGPASPAIESFPAPSQRASSEAPVAMVSSEAPAWIVSL